MTQQMGRPSNPRPFAAHPARLEPRRLLPVVFALALLVPGARWAATAPSKPGAAARDRPAEAEALYRRGEDERLAGNPSGAGAYYERALPLFEKADRVSTGITDCYLGRGQAALALGNPPKAEAWYQAALKVEERRPFASARKALALRLLIEPLAIMSRADESQRANQRALALLQRLKQSPDADPDVVSVTARLLDTLEPETDVNKTLPLVVAATEVLEVSAPGSLPLAGAYNQLGKLSLIHGNHGAARAHAVKALGIGRKVAPDSPTVGQSLLMTAAARLLAGNLQNLLVTGGQATITRAELEQAEREALAAESIGRRWNPDSLPVAWALGCLGIIDYVWGELDSAQSKARLAEAERRAKEAIGIYDRLSPGSNIKGFFLLGLAIIAKKQGHPDRAAAYQVQALALQKGLNLAQSDQLVGQAFLSRIGGGAEAMQEEERLARLAWGTVLHNAEGVSGDEARRGYGAQFAPLATRLVRAQVAQGKLEEAFRTLEESRAQALRRLLSERRVIEGTEKDPKWAEYRRAVIVQTAREKTLEGARTARRDAAAALARARSAGAEPSEVERLERASRLADDAYAQAESAYQESRFQVENAWAAIQRGQPRAFAPPVSLNSGLAALPKGTLYLAFLVDEERTFLFMLGAGSGPSRVRVVSVPVRRAELARLAGRLRGALRGFALTSRAVRIVPSGDGEGEHAQSGRSLFQQLFPSEVRAAIANSKRLLLCPDDVLWGVPFAALVTNEGGAPRYLGVEKPLTYTPSLSVFGALRREPRSLAPGRAPTALVMAPFAGRGGRLALPASASEAKEIAGLYRAKAHAGIAATKESAITSMPAADVIHFATHGLFDREQAMSSAILFDAPEGAPEAISARSELAAWEIHRQLKLRAELVVLSTCDIGQGEVTQGEGSVGMLRALQSAGARSVVAGQWEVPDAPTRELMLHFHRGLRTGKAKDEALRHAMQTLQKSPDTAHPGSWAAFFLAGDPENPNLGAASPAPPPRNRSSTPAVGRSRSGVAARRKK